MSGTISIEKKKKTKTKKQEEEEEELNTETFDGNRKEIMLHVQRDTVDEPKQS